MSKTIITSEVFVAYSQCPLKAFLLLFSDDQGSFHDYPGILEERRQVNKIQYLEKSSNLTKMLKNTSKII